MRLSRISFFYFPLFIYFAVSAEAYDETKSFFQEKTIFPLEAWRNHSPSLVEWKDGSLLACWFHGSGEKEADDVKILCSWLIASATQPTEWSLPFLLADTPNFPDCNPILFFTQQETTLWLMWSVIMTNEWGSALIKYRKASAPFSPPAIQWNWQEVLHAYPPPLQENFLSAIACIPQDVFSFLPKIHAEILYKKLYDNICLVILFFLLLTAVGFCWRNHFSYSKKHLLLTLGLGLILVGIISFLLLQTLQDKYANRLGWMTRCKPLSTQQGSLLVPLYTDTFSISLIARTTDEGQTWTFSEQLIGMGNIQPTLIQKNDGTIVAYMRDNGYYGKIRVSESQDDGITWSPVVSTDLDNPGSSIDIERLQNGHWILAYNDLMKGEHQLRISISEDEGKTWTTHRYLEQVDTHEAKFSYPTVIQARDGKIHCVYSNRNTDRTTTIKHLCFNETWVQSAPFLDEDSNRD